MIFNSNEGKKKKKKEKLNEMIFFFFNSNEDIGANFWVPFKMDPKFQDFEKLIFSLFAPIISSYLMLMCESILVGALKWTFFYIRL